MSVPNSGKSRFGDAISSESAANRAAQERLQNRLDDIEHRAPMREYVMGQIEGRKSEAFTATCAVGISGVALIAVAVLISIGGSVLRMQGAPNALVVTTVAWTLLAVGGVGVLVLGLLYGRYKELIRRGQHQMREIDRQYALEARQLREGP